MPFFGVELLAGLIPDLIYSTWAVALRKATTSSDNEPNMKSTSAIDVLGNSSLGVDLVLYGNDPYHLHPAKFQEHRQLTDSTHGIAELRDDQFITSF